MKKYVIFFFFIICAHTAYAQWGLFQKEFAKYPDILQFSVEMRGDTVDVIAVEFRRDSLTTLEKKRTEYYNL